MNELKVISTKAGIIETNFDEFHATLKLAIQDYKGLVVTEENLKEMKQTRLELTKAIKIIDDERKVQKKEFIIPLTAYENQCKTAIETIEEAEKELKTKIDFFDERVRQEKLAHAKEVALKLSAELNDKYKARVNTEKSEFTNVSTTKKKIEEDIFTQIQELEKLQKQEESNKVYVQQQLQTASKLAGLSTNLVIDDILHLVGNYETMDIASVTNSITSIALRRKESEELAVRQAEERIRLQEQRKAEAKERAEREAILAKEREEAREEQRKLEESNKNITKEILPFFTEEPTPFFTQEDFEILNEVEEVIEETEVIKVVCKKSETADIIRLLAINGFNCKLC
jgi:hypothetical protein